ncbi:MAG: PepSY-associated TM helix domain-containing protein [Verrucomicrobiota bacterium JB022]|nr:PepSY-associated TM helix domain-containing protein [Verrucomicrobiota bacterium JB022]
MKLKTIWKIHSLLGLFCGLGLLVIGLTGSVLVFHQEIANLLWPEKRLVAEVKPAEERIPLQQLVPQVEAAFPDFFIQGWRPRYDSATRDDVYLTRRGTDDWYILYLDPYTGETAPAPVLSDQTLQGWLVKLHYEFFAHQWGMIATALLALGFIGLGVTGVYIYRGFWKAFFRLRWRKSARIFFSDVHKMVGISTVPLNLILGLTGVWLNWGHLSHELEHHHHEEEHLVNPYEGDMTARLDEMNAKAQELMPGYVVNFINFPDSEDPQIYFFGTVPERHPFRNAYGSHLWMNNDTGEVTYHLDLSKASAWQRIENAFEPLHFGDFGGLFSKVIWCLAGLSPAVLAGSGTWIWWHRRRMQKKRPQRTQILAEPKAASQQATEPVTTEV